MDLKGKVALITGAAGAIGRAYTDELLRCGAKVAICDLDIEKGEKLVDDFSLKYGKGKTIFCQCDVTDYPQFEESFQTTISAFGGLDIVINNAGIFNDRFWELEVDVNLNGVIRGTLLAQRLMRKERHGKGGGGGVVVMTASTLGLMSTPCAPIHCATKHAIIGFTRSFADPFHYSLTGVRVMALCPGPTKCDTSSDEIKKALLSPEFEPLYHRTYDNVTYQSAQSVGKALIHILQKGTNGSVWVVENQQPPREVKFPSTF
ncbi:15-hydroxyprostaglandin dehydrogenase [NAD(+)] [Nilaparvata lugens]|uniref:15-hydroxyprostaglandin dehydrogenase [NAD(+)] n=1 Tax=Nilaparvata lugens TaxID=108931 RepID=UPI00193D3498|nr:15-hydroxyprostaglandin dehydrogenase [NAD(+)] [Nilaparvata lugens]